MTECIAILKDKFGRLEYKQELIRCRDCTYFDYGTDVGWCEYLDTRMQNNDYCSKAERKDEEK